MAKKIIKAQMKQRLDTKANWAAQNPVLLAGELGIVSDDPNLYKVGDGATAWNALPFRGFDGNIAQTTGTSETAVMSQKGVTGEIAKLSEKIEAITKLSLPSSVGFWQDVSPLKFNPDANSTHIRTEVQSGQVWRIKGMGSSFVAAYILIDAQGNITDSYKPSIIEVFDMEVTIPEGAAEIIVNSYKYRDTYVEASAETIVNVPSTILELDATNKEMSESIDDIETDLIDLSKGLLSSSPSNNIGFWTDAATPQYVDDANATYIKSQVTFGQVWHIKGMASTAVAAYIFLDAKGETIVTHRLAEIEVFDMEVTTPDGAAEIIVNSYKYRDSYVEASATMTYNTSQIVSELAAEISKIKAQSAASVLKDKTILCLGDSITEMKGYGDTSSLRYSDIISQMTGAETINGGIGGTHYSLREAPTATPTTSNSCYANLDLPSITEALASKDWSKQYASVQYIEDNNLATVGGAGSTRKIIDRLAEVDLANIDIVTILIGTNDMYDATLGAKGDTTPILSKYGAFRKVCKDLLSANPNLRIYYFSPIPRYMGGDSWAAFDPETIANNAAWSDNYKNGAGISFVSLVDACLDAAKECKIPSCDMYRTMGINEWNFKSIMMPEEVRYDGVHPFRGLRQIANRMVAFIESHNNLNL